MTSVSKQNRKVYWPNKDKMVSINNKNRVFYYICIAFFSIISATGCWYNIAPRESTIIDLAKENTNLCIILLLVFFFFYTFSLRVLFAWFDFWRDSCGDKRIKSDKLKVPGNRWVKISGVILCFWVPYLFICFPGTFAGTDFFWQLMQGNGVLPLSNHHPVFGSLVFGALYRIGYFIGGAEGGLFCIVLFQVLLMVSILGFCISAIREMGVSKKYCYFCVAFFSICPVFPLNIMWAVKDSIFSSLAILMFFSSYLYIWGKTNKVEVPIIASMPCLLLLAFLFSIYRNGVSIIAMIMLIIIASISIKQTPHNKLNIIKSVMFIVIFVLLLTGWRCCLTSLDVYPTNFSESVGIPSRQIMKCYELRKEKFTEDDIAELEYIYRHSVENNRPLEDIAASNDYRTADYVKPTPFESQKDVKRYISLWIRIGINNPELYLDEALRGSYAYWWPAYDPKEVFHATPGWTIKSHFEGSDFDSKLIKNYFGPLALSLRGDEKVLNQTMKQYLKAYPSIYAFTQLENRHEPIMISFLTQIGKIKSIPVLSIVLVPGLYSWIVFLCLLYMFTRKRQGVHMWPLLLIIALACLSPINGYMRYVLPVTIFSLFMIGFCLVPSQENASSEKEDVSSC